MRMLITAEKYNDLRNTFKTTKLVYKECFKHVHSSKSHTLDANLSV